MATPEDHLRKLAKLPQNAVCLNCGAEDKVFGFKNIVVKFRTFVCGHCKAAHQAYSHRVKVRPPAPPCRVRRRPVPHTALPLTPPPLTRRRPRRR